MNTANKESRKTTAGAWVALGIIIAIVIWIAFQAGAFTAPASTQNSSGTQTAPRSCITTTQGKGTLAESTKTTCE